MTILIIIISGFLNSSYYDEKAINTSALLNSLENDFDTNNYTNFIAEPIKEIRIIKNNTTEEQILVKKYSFENDDIKIFKYEK